jgi:Ca2+-binding EF-hand superfamily protein
MNKNNNNNNSNLTNNGTLSTSSSASTSTSITPNEPTPELRNKSSVRPVLVQEPIVTINDIFKQFDINVDGKITREELKKVMTSLFPNDNINDDDINNMLNEADFDRNGHIDFKGN